MVTKGNVLKKDAMIKALESSLGIVTNATSKVGISNKTHYQWLKEDPAYKERVDGIKESAIDFVESALMKNITKGNVVAQIFYLKTIGKSRGYIERTETQLTGDGINFIIKTNEGSLPQQTAV